ncbi:calcium/sodium antiporter [Microbacterium immunditiarum]|uniref:Cation:H+ antiporter n=1 Tax=Microbacterium immunditiarum TaxID=337480 RepID=A0A7Y9GMD9_9MICO|nr:calcium/sodium antiporter [Microbacterium immunditiarum]NYE19094.1 cation:H+ antiporter [Microbacterium immunditiarum]
MPPLLWIALGLAALVLGAELVVRYGARLARQLGLPPILIGLTVVSIGTSLPELAVGIDAANNDAGSLAVGNIAGTNMVNLLLILGLSAAIRSVPLTLQTVRLDLPMMGGAAYLLLIFSVDGALEVWEGIPLVAFALIYTALLVRWTRRESALVLAEFAAEYPAPPRREHKIGAIAIQALLLIVGLAVIVFGADWLVDGAVELAQTLGVSDALIGLTIVAIGTSAPELATTIVSTIRGDRDIAIGNLIGSSIFNLTMILGVTLLFSPGAILIGPELVYIDLPLMVAVSFICGPLMTSGRMLSRREGTGFVIAYIAYLTYLIVTRT